MNIGRFIDGDKEIPNIQMNRSKQKIKINKINLRSQILDMKKKKSFVVVYSYSLEKKKQQSENYNRMIVRKK